MDNKSKMKLIYSIAMVVCGIMIFVMMAEGTLFSKWPVAMGILLAFKKQVFEWCDSKETNETK